MPHGKEAQGGEATMAKKKSLGSGSFHLGENFLHSPAEGSGGTPICARGAGAHRSGKKDRRKAERWQTRHALRRGDWE